MSSVYAAALNHRLVPRREFISWQRRGIDLQSSAICGDYAFGFRYHDVINFMRVMNLLASIAAFTR